NPTWIGCLLLRRGPPKFPQRLLHGTASPFHQNGAWRGSSTTRNPRQPADCEGTRHRFPTLRRQWFHQSCASKHALGSHLAAQKKIRTFLRMLSSGSSSSFRLHGVL